MTDALPQPLTPADCDLQGFPFMKLHVQRLRDSDLAAEVDPEACWYAVLLWCASWHQVPAASLPDSDVALARLVGLGRDVKTWRKHRDGALRGFIKCADGRLYHPVVADQALEAWEGRETFRTERSAAAERQARWREDQKRMSARLRELGVTPPERTSKAALRQLLEEHDPEWSDAERYPEGVTSGNDHNVTVRNAVTSPVTSPETDSVTPVTPKRGRERGRVLLVDGGVACADAPASAHAPEPAHEGTLPPPTDLIRLTDEVCRAAGIRHVEPGPIIRHQELVRGWLDEGFDPQADILPAVRSGIATASEPVNSLKYFDRAIRQTKAKREAGHDHAHRNDEPTNPILAAALARKRERARGAGDDHAVPRLGRA